MARPPPPGSKRAPRTPAAAASAIATGPFDPDGNGVASAGMPASKSSSSEGSTRRSGRVASSSGFHLEWIESDSGASRNRCTGGIAAEDMVADPDADSPASRRVAQACTHAHEIVAVSVTRQIRTARHLRGDLAAPRPLPPWQNRRAMQPALERIVGKDNVLTGEADLLTYESDGLTHFRKRPRAVVLPATTAEVAAVVKWCASTGTPFVPRGAGTGLSGGALPCESGIVIELARMRRILEVNARDRFARVQCGVINVELSQAVKPLGLHYAPDPSSQTACTLGGNVAENSGGPHTMKYGTTTDHALGLTVVLPDGEIVEFGGPLAEMPGIDLVGTFVGSEGTFGIATELTVRLTPIPPSIRTFLFAFRELEQACRMVMRIVADGILPAALEMLDHTTIQVVEASVLAAGYPKDADAVLLVELDGLAQQVDDDARRVRAIGQEFGAFETREATTAEERLKLWKGRKGAFGALGRLSPDLYVQDAVVPRSKLPEVLKRVRAIATEERVRLSNVFHAGDGNLHPNISYDGRDKDEVARVVRAGERILATCVEAGGSLTGEHGIGAEKKDAMKLLFNEDDLDVFARVRRAFNPLGLCNPDKVLPGAKVCIEFRPGVAIEGVTT